MRSCLARDPGHNVRQTKHAKLFMEHRNDLRDAYDSLREAPGVADARGKP